MASGDQSPRRVGEVFVGHPERRPSEAGSCNSNTNARSLRPCRPAVSEGVSDLKRASVRNWHRGCPCTSHVETYWLLRHRQTSRFRSGRCGRHLRLAHHADLREAFHRVRRSVSKHRHPLSALHTGVIHGCVEAGRGVHECQMREALGKVADLALEHSVVLLRQQA